MKKLLNFLLCLTIVGFIGCEEAADSGIAMNENQGFTLEGSVTNGDSVLVLLDNRESGEWINIDSSNVENGKFSLSGSVKHAQMVYLKFIKGDDIEYVSVFVENNPMSFKGDLDDDNTYAITGSATNDLHEKFSERYDEYYELYDTLYTMMEASDDQEVKDSLTDLMEKVEDDSDDFVKEFVLANPGSQVAPYLALRHMTYSSDYDDLAPVVSAISAKIDESKYIDDLNETLAKMKVLAIGNVAPDFAQDGIDGTPIELTSLRGKYVLVDFWASWCQPCRRENPNVVAMYKEFSDRDFEIIGVSLDKDRDKWLKAIEDDQLTWQHVSDLQGWKNSVADIYNVKAIPNTYLLDKEGHIIAKNLRGDELKEKIRELLDTES